MIEMCWSDIHKRDLITHTQKAVWSVQGTVHVALRQHQMDTMDPFLPDILMFIMASHFLQGDSGCGVC